MKYTVFIRVFLAALLLVAAQAQASVGLVFGDMTCKEWSSTPPSLAKGAWIMGYLSGLNNLHMMSPQSKLDPLRNIKNGDEVFASVMTRCRNNVDADLSDTVTSIFLELLFKK